MVVLKFHRMKRENPERYAEFLKEKREYNKTHPETVRKASLKRYQKIKNNPILWKKTREMHKKYYAKKYKNDPEYRKKLAGYQREYWKRMKENDPEKYHAMQRGHQICKYITGVRCPNCGNPIKTTTIGFLGKRPVQCPNCRFSYPKNQCEKIRIPRIFPEAQKKTEETKKQPDEMIISEQALEGLRNLGMAFRDEMEEPKEIVGREKIAVENIKKKMAEYI